MRKIEVKPGYFRWNAYANGELFYSFTAVNLYEDVFRNSGARDADFDSLKNVADMYIEAMQDEMQDIDSWGFVYIYLTLDELTELRKQLVTAWARHFGISEA